MQPHRRMAIAPYNEAHMNNIHRPSQRLSIAGTHNIRDLGGYVTTANQVTRTRLLYRADKLHNLVPAAQAALLSHGIRTIIDLRYTPEVEMEPDAFVHSNEVRYVHLPLYELTGAEILPRVPDDLYDLYVLIIENRREQITRIMRTLMTPYNQPALFHCTAGKDRTGIIAALLLGAVGVSDEAIIYDYAISKLYLNELLDELRAQAALNGFDTDWYSRLLICEPETMQRTLQHINESYGGVVAYLIGSGITAREIDAFRAVSLTSDLQQA